MDLHTLITEFVIKLIRRVPLVGHELPTLPEHLSSPPVFSWIRVTRSLVLCVCFVDRCLPFCTFFLWPLCCLFFFDIRILITPLVSSNSSYNYLCNQCLSPLMLWDRISTRARCTPSNKQTNKHYFIDKHSLRTLKWRVFLQSLFKIPYLLINLYRAHLIHRPRSHKG